MLFVIIYAYWYPECFPFQIMFMSFNSNAMDVSSWTGTANLSGHPSSRKGFIVEPVVRSLVICVFSRSLCVLLSSFSYFLYDLLRFTTAEMGPGCSMS